MAKKFDKDSFSGTLIVVLVVSLICSIIVAGAVVGLKPIQEKQKLQDKQGYILSVAGLMDKNTDISKTFAERIEQRVVDLATGEYVADAPKDFSARVAGKDPAQSIQIKPEDDLAGIKSRAKYTEVYLVKGEDGKVSQIILPMHGNGLWSVMYGFVAMTATPSTALPTTTKVKPRVWAAKSATLCGKKNSSAKNCLTNKANLPCTSAKAQAQTKNTA